MKNCFNLERILTVITLAWLFFAQAHGADRLLVVGDATWGKWSLDRTSVMIRDNSNENLFRYTGWLKADQEFKFLAQAQWDQIEYRNASEKSL